VSVSFLIFRLYNVADEIDLEKSERLLADGKSVSRLRLKRVPPKSISFKNPPVNVELEGCRLPLGERLLHARAGARLYDYGVVTVTLSLDIPAVAYGEVLELGYIVNEKDLEETFLDYLRTTLAAIQPALVGAKEPEYEEEDLIVYYFRKWEKGWDPVPLLLAEKDPVSEEMRRETLKNRFSYAEDFAILTWDSAIVYDPTGSPDVPDLLEFANAQLLKLRYYDHILDQEIEEMYDAIEDADRGGRFRRLGNYRCIMRQLLGLVADITEITERIRNSLKVTEDVFYARIYTAALNILRVREWTESITQKVQVIERSYSMLSEEIVTYRSTALEVAIVLLIALEIVLFALIELRP